MNLISIVCIILNNIEILYDSNIIQLILERIIINYKYKKDVLLEKLNKRALTKMN